MPFCMKRICLSVFLAAGLVACTPRAKELTILHTNDTHSQVEPLDAKVKNGNLGGYVRRMEMIGCYRQTDNVLLVDAGDFCQGTPYFNLYRGRVEVDAMNRMGYDAATLGNHEFDNGVDTLAVILKKATFPIVCTNYDVKGTALEGLVKPYCIVKKQGLKIGIIGLTVDLNGLTMAKNYAGLTYREPVKAANDMADFLKNTEKCDLVICLSHLGYDEPPVCDLDLARNSKDIDVIVGGHSHTMVVNEKVPNLPGDTVIIAQMGKSGAYLGCMKLKFE